MKYLIIFILLTGCVTPRPWTKTEKTMAIISIGTGIADGWSTIHMLNNPNNYERNPSLGKHPSDSEVIMYLSLWEMACLGIAHYFPKTRVWLLGGKIIIDTTCTINNVNLD